MTQRPSAAARRKWAAYLRLAKSLRLAWADGHGTLYKFKSLRGESFAHVLQTITQSRIYFPTPTQFNDPLDCAPVFKLAGDPDDPAFERELLDDQQRMMNEAGLTPEQAAAVDGGRRVDAADLAEAVTEQTRRVLRSTNRILCLSTEHDHPLLWSHYADSHTGVCLHFSSRGGTFFGGARRVLYRRNRASILIPTSHTPKDQIPERMAFHKATFWRYEHEYRLMANEAMDDGGGVDAQGFADFDIGLLTGITLGCGVSAANRATLLWAAGARRPRLDVYEAVENVAAYRMDVRPVPW